MNRTAVAIFAFAAVVSPFATSPQASFFLRVRVWHKFSDQIAVVSQGRQNLV